MSKFLIGVALLIILPITITFESPKFKIQKIFEDEFAPSTMAFLGPDDLVVLDRDNGIVFRLTQRVKSGPLLDVNVATRRYMGLIGVAVSTGKDVTMYFYITPSPLERTVAKRADILLTRLEIDCTGINLSIIS
jgi:hypothetical protein